ncbi:MAG: translational GTPase TypA [bacterium]
MSEIRNIAIIAHVDHGKTTLIDSLLAQTGVFRENQQVDERIMDCNDLEKERGITILAKCTSIDWHQEDKRHLRINIIDTPGHADFGGEVERVLSMADCALLLVDAAEGPMPQTKFVLSKALSIGLRPIVVINKLDRPDSRPDEVIDEVFDLFVALDATEEQLDFPHLYASGRDGWCIRELEDEKRDLTPLLKLIGEHVPPPSGDVRAPFSLLVSILESDPFLGRVLTGLVYSGCAQVNQQIKSLDLQGAVIEQGRLTRLQCFSGVKRVPVDKVKAGDIVSIAGLVKTSVADTIGDLSLANPLPATPIDPPTMAVTVRVNDSPLAGQEGKKVTSRMIRERLMAEAESNVAVTVEESEAKGTFEVGGRGELQLGVLIESMRREGFELSVSRPRVLFKKNELTGACLEPVEEVVVDVDDQFSGIVVEKISQRKGELHNMRPCGGGKTRLTFYVPSRGLIGYQGEFLQDTRGTGVINRLFHDYEPFKGDLARQKPGALISMNQGKAVAYALWKLEERGIMFTAPNTQVYEGMIIGQNNRDNDLEVNVLKGKQLTNVRAAGSDDAIRLTPAIILSLEQMIAYIGDDELVEVTPQSLRLRKKILNPHERKRSAKTRK